MNDRSKQQSGHPVLRTLEELENLLQTCKEIALLGALNEEEGLVLQDVTEAIIALHDVFADRELEAALKVSFGEGVFSAGNKIH